MLTISCLKNIVKEAVSKYTEKTKSVEKIMKKKFS